VDGVQIWQTPLDAVTSAELQRLAKVLSPSERRRAARFHFARDRNHYVACRGLLRELLASALKQPAERLVLKTGMHGKPEIAADADGRRPRFNLSHSEGWVMFAVAWDREVGIDLESGTRLDPDENNLAALARRILSERELAAWQSLPDARLRRGAFLRAWTRKEAFAKATGKGVLEQWERIELVLDAEAPNSSLVVRPADQPGSWVVHDLAAPSGFAAALALEQKEN
jgi:4'-phosphopantetheinyl transferase